MVYSVLYLCRSDGMADVTDSKSVGSDTVWVRVPPSAPRRSKVRFAPTSFFCLRQKRRHPHAPLLLLSNCDPLCWLAVGRPPCGRHSSPIGGLGGSPVPSGQGAVRFAPASFFCLRQKRRHPHAPLLLLSNCDPLCWLAVGRPPCGRHSFPIGGLRGSPVPSRPEGPSALLRRLFLPAAKKTPSARSLAPPFQLRPALLARSWQAALRAAFFSNRRSRGGPVPSRPGGRPLCSGVFFLPAAKKTPSARSLAPPFQLRPALLARSWQAALRAAFFSNRRSRVSPFLPGWGPSALLRYFLSPAKNAIRTPGRQSSAAVSVYHIPFALSRQGRRCAHFHSP